jgi:hypothetical protein
MQYLSSNAIHNAVGAESARERDCTSYFSELHALHATAACLDARDVARAVGCIKGERRL